MNSSFGILMILKLILLGILVVPSYSYSKPHNRIRIDEVPMYGGMDRSKYRKLRKGDKKLMKQGIKEFGSREKASQQWVEVAYKFYFANKLGMAMRRFNQAWLFNPQNPEVYSGFGAVLYEQGKNCKSMEMMKKALSLNPPTNQGIYPDAAKSITTCAIIDKSLSSKEKQKMFEQSNELFRKAEEIESNKAYLYGVWASAYYWQEKYQKAWKMVNKQKQLGGKPNKKFIELLSTKYKNSK